ncbi:TIGR03620 family F420-dependent LLM class oxidoreductase [Streptomyces pinistramenti]|uniref:TIGR03620 family F420-dependent LLM class oxidoreductase n=1 Tax=Streptomyces pinistramenti TaxID=2884812 RepID=UPI001D088156|nr:TIGR03620 family F420-dependent LLM class oxidoreductase [Streptomyces pinistramenti]MCB5909033.1 TIGR03620 family F420-dependent LLM class oxidoreductase [Streptomyces pinistramenti]
MDLGVIGVWSVALTHGDRAEAADAAAELEALGYGTLWLGGIPGGNPRGDLVTASEVLAATRRAGVALSCVSIWKQPAAQLSAAYGALPARQRDRLMTGLAVSHAPFADRYEKPCTAMRRYLDALDTTATPLPPAARIIGAHRPQMLRLAAARTAGAQPYLVGPEQVARARELLGARPVLAPVQTVVPHTDPDVARARARSVLAPYLALPNLTATWLGSGFGEEDLAGGGSDRLVDELVAWGDAETIAARIAALRRAGADHVAVQVATDDPRHFPRAAWRELADAVRAA